MTEAQRLERKLFALIGRRASLVAKFDEEISKVRAAIIEVGCPHTDFRTFKWEHDNGYGRQSMCEGHRCETCGKKNYYPTMSKNWHE